MSFSRSSFLLLICSFTLALTACNGGGGGGDGDGDAGPGGDGGTPYAKLRIDPEMATLKISGTTPATQTFQVFGELADGSEKDVTAEATLTIDRPSLGAMAGALFTSGTSQGGRGTVTANIGNARASADLTLVLEQRRTDPTVMDLPADPGSLFGGPEDAARAPQVVYPNDGVLVPPNLGRLETHFYPGTGNTVFEVSFTNALTDVIVYTRCTTPLNNGCIYALDSTVWSWIAETNRGSAPVTVKVRGTNDTGTAVGASTTTTIAFSQDSIKGALYYWTTAPATLIKRFDFAGDATSAETFLDTSLSNGSCVGCHALSRDGKKMVVSTNGSTDANVLLLGVSTVAPMVPYNSTPRSAFSSWAPDASQFVGVYAYAAGAGFVSHDLNIFDGTTGALAETIDVGGTDTSPATHPDWSADGSRIAFTRMTGRTAGSKSLAQGVYAGDIEMVTKAGGAWGAPEVVVPTVAGKNRYYPTFAPDDSILVFDESTCPGGTASNLCDGYEDPSARMFVATPTPGATPVELLRANTKGVTDTVTDLKSSFPKWAPFVFRRTDEFGSKLLWLTFSSNRNFGLRKPPTGGTLLWMVAVDPTTLASGDPSFTAFALPFQDLDTSNHTAQWATEAVVIE